MKYFFFLAFLMVFIASCNNPDGNNEGNIPIDSTFQSQDSALSKPHSKKKIDSTTLYYEPNVSVLTGTLMEDEFYGAPGYGATPDKDAKEKQFILYLDNPIKVKAGKESDKGLETKNHIDRITLIVDKKSTKFRNNIGKTIKVKGKLFPAETGHHHTSVLLGDAEIVK